MNSGCSYQQLYYNNEREYIVRCVHCKNIQVAYGNFLLSFEPNVLRDFQYLLETINGDYPFMENSLLRRIQIPLQYNGISLLLSKKELSELITMLDKADSELQILSLMELLSTDNPLR
jgi:hypothetical protein